jgi:hypothetical protein
MARRKAQAMYQRVFFDRTLLTGIIFLSIAYVMRGSLVGAFAEAAAFVVGIIWSYRAATTNPHLGFRLLSTLMLLLIGCLLAVYFANSQFN